MSASSQRPLIRGRRTFAPMDAPPADTHPKVLRMIEHWRSLIPAPGRLPGRQHFEPMRVPDLLPNIWLLDVVPEDARRYRVRLLGGAIVEAGANLRRGKFFADCVTPEEAVEGKQVFDAILRDKHIDWRRGASALRHMDRVNTLERVMLPLAADGVTVDLIMCFSVFYWHDGSTR